MKSMKTTINLKGNSIDQIIESNIYLEEISENIR